MLRGRVIIDTRTKELVKRIKPGQIAVIKHQDIDQVAGQSLIDSQVKAVLNQSPSISGKYPNLGPELLLEAGIPLIDIISGNLFHCLRDGDEIFIKANNIYKAGRLLARGKVLSTEEVAGKMQEARKNLSVELNNFIENTLNYARKEKNIILDLPVPELNLDFRGRQALIVIRGADYKDDLAAIKTYIEEVKPLIIAVDGGADACLERGYQPDLIIGDMDSVTDKALLSGSLIVVHAYPDGRAPGLERVKKLGLEAIPFPAPGTSEDIAMLLAYEKGAELITVVGSHSHMIDFLEKGRPGMASTLLVRLKIGDKLVDAKGVSKLYQSQIHYHYWIQLLLAILLPLSFLSFLSPQLNHLLQLLLLKLALIFDF